MDQQVFFPLPISFFLFLLRRRENVSVLVSSLLHDVQLCVSAALNPTFLSDVCLLPLPAWVQPITRPWLYMRVRHPDSRTHPAALPLLPRGPSPPLAMGSYIGRRTLGEQSMNYKIPLDLSRQKELMLEAGMMEDKRRSWSVVLFNSSQWLIRQHHQIKQLSFDRPNVLSLEWGMWIHSGTLNLLSFIFSLPTLKTTAVHRPNNTAHMNDILEYRYCTLCTLTNLYILLLELKVKVLGCMYALSITHTVHEIM